MQWVQYSLSCNWKPGNFTWTLPLVDSDSTNISRITNLKAGGETAAKTAQWTYWSCYNTIRTQILNCSQTCGNHEVGTAVRLQPCQNPRFYVQSGQQPAKRKWVGLLDGSGTELNWFSGPNPDPLVTLAWAADLPSEICLALFEAKVYGSSMTVSLLASQARFAWQLASSFPGMPECSGTQWILVAMLWGRRACALQLISHVNCSLRPAPGVPLV